MDKTPIYPYPAAYARENGEFGAVPGVDEIPRRLQVRHRQHHPQ